MSDWTNLKERHRKEDREKLPESYQLYRDLEIETLCDNIIRRAGGKAATPAYLREIAAYLLKEAAKRDGV